ncbi:MAG: hypothetical protein LBE27_07335, partial [Deltaproteobacteria bacterium]|nr:hypothetical protein [Deltaproteobacteria bacterium]
MISHGKARDIFNLVGPIALLLGCFFGVFSRGVVNASFALLFLWALLAFTIFFKERIVPSPPGIYLLGLALFLFSYLLSSIFSGRPQQSFSYLANITYLLLTALSVWVALSYGRAFLPRIVPYCYGLGLVLWFLIAWSEASFCLDCFRAKADLGIIESGAVLAQVIPLMLGAMAICLYEGKKGRAILFAIFLAFGGLCLYLNCSRIALIVVPISGALMLFAFRKCFGRLVAAIIALCVAMGALIVLGDEGVLDRFKGMFESAESNASNQVRYVHWRQGL